MGRAARKGSSGGTIRVSFPIDTLQEKYKEEGRLDDNEWLHLQGLQHGIDLQELPPVFSKTLRDLPASAREVAFRRLAEEEGSKEIGRIDEAGEILALIRTSVSSERPQLSLESESGLQVHLDREYRLHNIDGPAVIWPNGTEGFYEHGQEVRDGRPCRIYPDGSREYWDSHDGELGMNVYKRVNPNGESEWLLETGQTVRRIDADGNEKIFPGGILGFPLNKDPYSWAGQKFQNNPDAYDTARTKYTSRKTAIDGTPPADLYKDIAQSEHIKKLLESRHPFLAQSFERAKEKAALFRDLLRQE